MCFIDNLNKEFVNEGRMKSLFLTKMPSFYVGFARVGDLFGSYDDYNYSQTAIDADMSAIKRDWEIVFGDLANALEALKKEYKAQLQQIS